MDNLGSRLKDIRLKAGLTLRELARKSDVSPSFVSQIENGKSQPSVATLYTFAQLLGVSIDELFDQRGGEVERPALVEGWGPNGAKNPTNAWHPSEYANRVSVVHPSHRSSLTMAEGVIWERLAATPEHAVNFMKITYAPGATSTGAGDLVSHEGYEYGYVLKGTLEIVVGSETFTLNEGESMGFDSMIPHRLRNVGEGEFEGIWFVHGRERPVSVTDQRKGKTDPRASEGQRRTKATRRLGARPAGGRARGAVTPRSTARRRSTPR
ncbi:MAG TPA: XRE family transcriptional regulator [Kofleriaceae bacterium]|nr:XRE family transcriptional regulator [Kofleriaceae bacterium]